MIKIPIEDYDELFKLLATALFIPFYSLLVAVIIPLWLNWGIYNNVVIVAMIAPIVFVWWKVASERMRRWYDLMMNPNKTRPVDQILTEYIALLEEKSEKNG